MPRFNGTGPAAVGPGTGRGMGPCGAGRRWQRGFDSCCLQGYSLRNYALPKNQRAALDNEEKMLEEALVAVREEKASLKDQQK